jgi:isocitrate/isopropylmalate dehydrogenase
MSSVQTFEIASIPGDGIGTEITTAAIQVLDKLAEIDGSFKFDYTHFDWSSKAYKERGWYMPPDGMAQLQKHDAIYFGAVGWPGIFHACLYKMECN